MPSDFVKGGPSGTEQPFCSICLENITEEHAYVNECFHVFHFDCIRGWASHENPARVVCPNCKRGFSSLIYDVFNERIYRTWYWQTRQSDPPDRVWRRQLTYARRQFAMLPPIPYGVSFSEFYCLEAYMPYYRSHMRAAHAAAEGAWRSQWRFRPRNRKEAPPGFHRNYRQDKRRICAHPLGPGRGEDSEEERKGEREKALRRRNRKSVHRPTERGKSLRAGRADEEELPLPASQKGLSRGKRMGQGGQHSARIVGGRGERGRGKEVCSSSSSEIREGESAEVSALQIGLSDRGTGSAGGVVHTSAEASSSSSSSSSASAFASASSPPDPPLISPSSLSAPPAEKPVLLLGDDNSPGKTDSHLEAAGIRLEEGKREHGEREVGEKEEGTGAKRKRSPSPRQRGEEEEGVFFPEHEHLSAEIQRQSLSSSPPTDPQRGGGHETESAGREVRVVPPTGEEQELTLSRAARPCAAGSAGALENENENDAGVVSASASASAASASARMGGACAKRPFDSSDESRGKGEREEGMREEEEEEEVEGEVEVTAVRRSRYCMSETFVRLLQTHDSFSRLRMDALLTNDLPALREEGSFSNNFVKNFVINNLMVLGKVDLDAARLGVFRERDPPSERRADGVFLGRREGGEGEKMRAWRSGAPSVRRHLSLEDAFVIPRQPDGERGEGGGVSENGRAGLWSGGSVALMQSSDSSRGSGSVGGNAVGSRVGENERERQKTLPICIQDSESDSEGEGGSSFSSSNVEEIERFPAASAAAAGAGGGRNAFSARHPVPIELDDESEVEVTGSLGGREMGSGSGEPQTGVSAAAAVRFAARAAAAAASDSRRAEEVARQAAIALASAERKRKRELERRMREEWSRREGVGGGWGGTGLRWGTDVPLGGPWMPRGPSGFSLQAQMKPPYGMEGEPRRREIPSGVFSLCDSSPEGLPDCRLRSLVEGQREGERGEDTGGEAIARLHIGVLRRGVEGQGGHESGQGDGDREGMFSRTGGGRRAHAEVLNVEESDEEGGGGGSSREEGIHFLGGDATGRTDEGGNHVGVPERGVIVEREPDGELPPSSCPDGGGEVGSSLGLESREVREEGESGSSGAVRAFRFVSETGTDNAVPGADQGQMVDQRGGRGEAPLSVSTDLPVWRQSQGQAIETETNGQAAAESLEGRGGRGSERLVAASSPSDFVDLDLGVEEGGEDSQRIRPSSSPSSVQLVSPHADAVGGGLEAERGPSFSSSASAEFVGGRGGESGGLQLQVRSDSSGDVDRLWIGSKEDSREGGERERPPNDCSSSSYDDDDLEMIMSRDSGELAEEEEEGEEDMGEESEREGGQSDDRMDVSETEDEMDVSESEEDTIDLERERRMDEIQEEEEYLRQAGRGDVIPISSESSVGEDSEAAPASPSASSSLTVSAFSVVAPAVVDLSSSSSDGDDGDGDGDGFGDQGVCPDPSALFPWCPESDSYRRGCWACWELLSCAERVAAVVEDGAIRFAPPSRVEEGGVEDKRETSGVSSTSCASSSSSSSSSSSASASTAVTASVSVGRAKAPSDMPRPSEPVAARPDEPGKVGGIGQASVGGDDECKIIFQQKRRRQEPSSARPGGISVAAGGQQPNRKNVSERKSAVAKEEERQWALSRGMAHMLVRELAAYVILGGNFEAFASARIPRIELGAREMDRNGDEPEKY
uniref:RING-type domain-containing protein n=1 Tax=Chromera velia CCMP2878 TaxID=1169474 RepID=A0A0G4FT40_9ALVE|eukprot:Cvel_18603.t1-p1 / transcript=Cvel_18603.t1 / gene=Cvel_18603 / organism=Chromera_velia_CCMP2878 / gene_product=hypothetical protein / transcript_product=hypothetical protein / location=Cvel_scaffold1552:14255-20476(+) / protein_length=1680 / sequence_SO=supercontig / SO=protein_coding / is_pseudo=false